MSFIPIHSGRGALAALALLVSACATSGPAVNVPCSATGAPPIETVSPVSTKPTCKVKGRLLTFDQNGVERYACLNLPQQADSPACRQWPLIIYLHGSETTVDSLYEEGAAFFQLHDTFALSNEAGVQGFVILSPEARRAKAWPSAGGATGTGVRWDEWYRDPATNLDIATIDEFLDQTLATGLIDPSQIYVFGWSNGAFTAALYGVWRSDRIAAIGQYAGANPWSRPPCPIAMPAGPQVPLILLRNLCDGVVPCSLTSQWIANLTAANWPFEFYNLLEDGSEAPPTQTACATVCGHKEGIHDHIRWPQQPLFTNRLLPFFKQHGLGHPSSSN